MFDSRSRAELVTVLTLLVAAQPLAAQDWKSLSSSRQRSSEERLEVDLEYAAGTLRLASAEAGQLYRADLRYDSDIFDPHLRYRDGRLRLDMEGEGFRSGNHEPGTFDLRLARGVALDVSLKFGAGTAEMDFGGLTVKDLSVQTGASKTRLSFSEPNPARMRRAEFQVGAAEFRVEGLGNANVEEIRVEGGVGEVTLDFTGALRGETRLSVKMGLGAVRLILPRGLAVRVDKTGLLASFDSQGFIKRGSSFYSEWWGEAETRLIVDVEAAFSEISVQWVNGGTS